MKSTSPSDYPCWARCLGCFVCIASLPALIVVASFGVQSPNSTVYTAALLSLRGLSTLTNNRKYNDGPLASVFGLFVRNSQKKRKPAVEECAPKRSAA